MTPLFYIPIDGTYHICDAAHKRHGALYWRTQCGAVVHEIVCTPTLPDGARLCTVCREKMNQGDFRKTLPKVTKPLPNQLSFLEDQHDARRSRRLMGRL